MIECVDVFPLFVNVMIQCVLYDSASVWLNVWC